MPDAYGNLQNINEFTTGLKVRFISYMGGGDYALSIYDSDEPGDNEVALRYLPNDGLQIGWGWTVFTLEARPGGLFRATGQGPDGTVQQLCMTNLEGYIIMTFMPPSAVQEAGGDAVASFTVDMVDGVWFAFNNHDRTRVVDVQESQLGEGAPIIGFPWNGGDNQRWRACIATDA